MAWPTSRSRNGADCGVAFQLTPIYGVTIPVIVRLGNLQATAGIALQRAHPNAELRNALGDLLPRRLAERLAMRTADLVDQLRQPLLFPETVEEAVEAAQRGVGEALLAACQGAGIDAFKWKALAEKVLVPLADVLAQSPVAAPWWQHAVIYEIYPQSFADSGGDGMAADGAARIFAALLAQARIERGSRGLREFARGLEAVVARLAHMLVADGVLRRRPTGWFWPSSALMLSIETTSAPAMRGVFVASTACPPRTPRLSRGWSSNI